MAPLVYRKRDEPGGNQPGSLKTADAGGRRAIMGFKLVHVFDVTQTEGDELPEFARIGGDPGQLLCSLEELIRANGIVLNYEVLRGGAEGVSRRGEIGISVHLETAERFAVLAHELAHEWMHDAEQRKSLAKTVRETEAEAVAYVVCTSFGLDCSSRSSDYIQMYRGDDATLIASLDRIQKTASRMIHSLSQSKEQMSEESLVA